MDDRNNGRQRGQLLRRWMDTLRTSLTRVQGKTRGILHWMATKWSIWYRFPSRKRKRLRTNTMKLLFTIMAMISLATISLADISEGVKSWLKEQGCVLKAEYRLVP